MKYFFILSLFVSSNLALGKGLNRAYGHNVSHTDFFPRETCEVGIKVMACGQKDWAIASSPFLWADYSMANFYFVKRLDHDLSGDISTFQASYIKTFNDESDPYAAAPYLRKNSTYQQESVQLYHIYSTEVTDNYRLHFNTSLYYFFKGTHPFSIRRPTVKKRKYQLNLTVLQEVQMTDHMGILTEFGMLHLTANYPRFHTGVSIYHRKVHWLFQVGFSMTATLKGLFVGGETTARNDYQQELRTRTAGYDGELDSGKNQK